MEACECSNTPSFYVQANISSSVVMHVSTQNW